MKRLPVPLHWQVALVCSTLAALLVSAVLGLAERLVVSHFEAVAEAQADDVARAIAGLFSRALERRATELQLLARSAALSNLANAPEVRAELERLAGMAPIYRAIAVADPSGSVLAASDGSRLPASIAGWPVSTQAAGGVWLGDTRAAASRGGSPQAVNVDLGVPLQDAAGGSRGVLVAELDWDWFRGLRDEVLARSSNATVLSVAVFARDGRPLMSDLPALDEMALHAFAARAPGANAGRMRFGPSATRVLAAQSELQQSRGMGALGWRVVVAQDLDAALQPVLRLQQLVVLSGVGLAATFSILVYVLARRVVRPYAGLLDAVTARFRADDAAHAVGLTRYLDALSAQLEATPIAAMAPHARPQARAGVQQPLEVVDMLALIAEDATRLQHLLDALPIGVIVFDGALRVMYWNRCCESIFGWAADEVIGHTPFETYAAERTAAEAAEIIARVNERHETYSVTRGYRRRDGSTRHCALIISPERDAGGKLIRILALVQDVTEQLLADASRAQYAQDVSALARQLLDHDAQVTRRLAQTLHDRLGQTLSALRLAFDAVDARSGDTAAWGESPMGLLIDLAVAEVREALVELRPPLLDEQGLEAALDNETRSLRCNPNRVEVAFTVEGEAGERRYPADVEYAAFMVAREAIGNALRHAAARRIGVRLTGRALALSLEVEDDGHGFNQEGVVSRPGHLGLVGMRERALAVGAVLSMHALPGAGCCVRFDWADAGMSSPAAALDVPDAHPTVERDSGMKYPGSTPAAAGRAPGQTPLKDQPMYSSNGDQCGEDAL